MNKKIINDIKAIQTTLPKKADLVSGKVSSAQLPPLNYLPLTGGTVTGNVNITGNVTTSSVTGALWNDYAEYRIVKGLIKDEGRVVIEIGNDRLALCNERLNPTALFISDTYGYLIGAVEQEKIEGEYSRAIAVAGRILAHTQEDRDSFKIGDLVCSGLNGTVSKMTEEEIRLYPYCVIGVVSSIPDYEYWQNKVKVNNRIWVKIK